MKAPFLRPLTCLLTVIMFMAFTARLHAAPVDLLRDAYINLAQADHDYKGHRVDAMRQVAEAAKLLGVKLRDHAKDHEKQGVSDTHLREAAGLVQRASSGLSGKALRHARLAEKEIDIALRIK